MNKIEIAKGFISICWGFLIVLIFFSSFKNQLILGRDLKMAVSTMFPEGWGFFTKNPRDYVFKVYNIKNDNLIEVDMKNSSKAYYFGLSREARMIGYELSTILEDISRKNWIDSNSKNLHNHINDKTNLIDGRGYFSHFKKNETYIVKIFSPIPYKWSKAKQEINNPFYVIKFKII